MNKHTPTPWHAPGFAEVMDKDNRVIALCVDVDPVEEQSRPVPEIDEGQANAAHIVLCVNSHDALVAQMINALELIELLRANSSDRVVVENTQLSPMYAALAAAGAPQ